MSRGKDAETLIQQLCEVSYLADYVAPSPQFRKPGGKELEAADVLLFFGTTILAIQVKSYELAKPTEELTEVDLGRIARKLDAGINQVTTIKRGLRDGSLKSVRNARGLEIPLGDPASLRIIGIALLMSHRQGHDLHIVHGLEDVHGTPVHAFTDEAFMLAVQELTTIPDLLAYLDARHTLLSNNALLPTTSEVDFLAAYLTRWETVMACVTKPETNLLIEPDLWVKLQDTRSEEFAKRHARIEASRIFDYFLTKVHQCVGYDAATEVGTAVPAYVVPDHHPATAAQYFEIATALASVRRITRIELAAKICEKLAAADTRETAFFVAGPLENDSVFVFLATDLPRPERLLRLRAIAASATLQFNLTRAIGIATNAGKTLPRCDDFVLLENPGFKDHTLARELAAKLFGNKRGVNRDEWGNDYAAAESPS